jgi:hypothetical protein
MIENFVVNDNFYSTISDYIELQEDGVDIIDLPNDWSIEVELTELEKVFYFDEYGILDLMERDDTSRLGDDNDEVRDEIRELIKKSFDFEKFNSNVPKLYYTNGKKLIITKKDLLLNEI